MITQKTLIANILTISLYLTPALQARDITIKIAMDDINAGKVTLLPVATDQSEQLELGERAYTPAPGGEITTPAFQYPIKASDLATPLTSGASQYIIKSPGRYYVANDLVSRVNTLAASTMLEIASNNVVLDLNSKSLRPALGTGTNSTTITGIKIDGSLSNIVIRNGQINGYATTGTTSAMQLGISIDGAVNRNIQISDITIANLGGTSATAISMTGGVVADTKDIVIQNCIISNLNSTSAAAYGLKLSSCNNVRVVNCNFNGVTTSSSATTASYGAYLSGCSTVTFDGCVATETGISSGTGCGNSVGFELVTGTTCKDITFLNCEATRTFTNASSSSAVAIGFRLNDSTGPYKLVNCLAAQSSGAGAEGFHAAATSIFDNCTADSNAGTTTASYGFYLTAGAGSKLKNCLADKNSATTGGCTGIAIVASSDGTILDTCSATSTSSSKTASTFSTTGITISGSNSCKLLNCSVGENSCSGTTGNVAGIALLSACQSTLLGNCSSDHNTSSSTGDVYGFYQAGATGTRYLNCQARNNTNTTGTSANAAGFYSTSSGSANEFTNCVANNNSTSVASATGTAAGIWLVGETRSQINGCDCSANNGGNSPAASQTSYGVYLQTSCSNTTIKDCGFKFNTGYFNFGFFDDAADTTSVLINNVAIGQGRCIALLTSSFQFPTGTSMNYYFKFTGDQENPANMIHETDNFNWTTVSTAVQNWSNISVAVGEVS